ncbi:proteinase-activated receptor 1-like [Protopterus annectens]|uniref:proteinase-activated receptor 1-like n=1 Tax=Protopterus annectens TaxID=7888 RepID=UPI001CF95D43|nr:proteinase-activated receptor 1-like [Protopterus annectens]
MLDECEDRNYVSDFSEEANVRVEENFWGGYGHIDVPCFSGDSNFIPPKCSLAINAFEHVVCSKLERAYKDFCKQNKAFNLNKCEWLALKELRTKLDKVTIKSADKGARHNTSAPGSQEDGGWLITNGCQSSRNHELICKIIKYVTGWHLSIFVPSVYTLVLVVGLPLNFFMILALVFRIKLNKPSQVYIFNLAISDLLFTFSLPLKIVYYFSGSHWPFGSVMCQIVSAAYYCNMYCSILLITGIAVDKFLAVVYPLNSLSWRRCSYAYAICCTIWIIAIAGTIPLLPKEQTFEIAEHNITTCHDVSSSELQQFYQYYFQVLCSAFFFVPLIVNLVSYICVIRILSRKNNVNRTKKTKAIFLSATVFIVFIVCFLPTNILLCVHYLQNNSMHGDSVYFYYLLSVCISSLNCCFDPLIYYFASSECQKLVQNYLSCKNHKPSDTSKQNTECLVV